jgi:hypothetical protein
VATMARVFSGRPHMSGVFISYRREDSPGHAGRIFDRLRTRLGSDLVFMDVDAIEPGADFGAAIESAVGSCDALLAVIGPGWVSAAARDGRRLDDPHDFVRLEIVGALKRNVRVVPVLVDNAEMPIPDELPDALKPLARRNALVLRDSRWDADIDELVLSVERLITRRNEATGRPIKLARFMAARYRPWGAAAGIVLVAAGILFGPRACGLGFLDEPKPALDEAARAPNGIPAAAPEKPTSQAPSQPATPRKPEPVRRTGLGIVWFGLWLDTVTDSPTGVIVGRVAPGGPAANAGILANDVLVEVAGHRVTSFSDVADAVADHVKSTPPGTSSIVEIDRKGKRLRLSVVFDREFRLR